MPVISSDRLARRVYDDMAEELAKLQLRVVTLDALVDRFGDKALPQDTLARSGTRNLMSGGAVDAQNRLRKITLGRIAELTETMAMFEQVFAEQEEADFAAFADYIRKTYGKRQSKGMVRT